MGQFRRSLQKLRLNSQNWWLTQRHEEPVEGGIDVDAFEDDYGENVAGHAHQPDHQQGHALQPKLRGLHDVLVLVELFVALVRVLVVVDDVGSVGEVGGLQQVCKANTKLSGAKDKLK